MSLPHSYTGGESLLAGGQGAAPPIMEMRGGSRHGGARGLRWANNAGKSLEAVRYFRANQPAGAFEGNEPEYISLNDVIGPLPDDIKDRVKRSQRKYIMQIDDAFYIRRINRSVAPELDAEDEDVLENFVDTYNDIKDETVGSVISPMSGEEEEIVALKPKLVRSIVIMVKLQADSLKKHGAAVGVVERLLVGGDAPPNTIGPLPKGVKDQVKDKMKLTDDDIIKYFVTDASNNDYVKKINSDIAVKGKNIELRNKEQIEFIKKVIEYNNEKGSYAKTAITPTITRMLIEHINSLRVVGPAPPAPPAPKPPVPPAPKPPAPPAPKPPAPTTIDTIQTKWTRVNAGGDGKCFPYSVFVTAKNHKDKGVFNRLLEAFNISGPITDQGVFNATLRTSIIRILDSLKVKDDIYTYINSTLTSLKDKTVDFGSIASEFGADFPSLDTITPATYTTANFIVFLKSYIEKPESYFNSIYIDIVKYILFQKDIGITLFTDKFLLGNKDEITLPQLIQSNGQIAYPFGQKPPTKSGNILNILHEVGGLHYQPIILSDSADLTQAPLKDAAKTEFTILAWMNAYLDELKKKLPAKSAEIETIRGSMGTWSGTVDSVVAQFTVEVGKLIPPPILNKEKAVKDIKEYYVKVENFLNVLPVLTDIGQLETEYTNLTDISNKITKTLGSETLPNDLHKSYASVVSLLKTLFDQKKAKPTDPVNKVEVNNILKAMGVFVNKQETAIKELFGSVETFIKNLPTITTVDALNNSYKPINDTINIITEDIKGEELPDKLHETFASVVKALNDLVIAKRADLKADTKAKEEEIAKLLGDLKKKAAEHEANAFLLTLTDRLFTLPDSTSADSAAKLKAMYDEANALAEKLKDLAPDSLKSIVALLKTVVDAADADKKGQLEKLEAELLKNGFRVRRVPDEDDYFTKIKEIDSLINKIRALPISKKNLEAIRPDMETIRKLIKELESDLNQPGIRYSAELRSEFTAIKENVTKLEAEIEAVQKDSEESEEEEEEEEEEAVEEPVDEYSNAAIRGRLAAETKAKFDQALNIYGDKFDLNSSIEYQYSHKPLKRFLTDYGIGPDYQDHTDAIIRAFFAVFPNPSSGLAAGPADKVHEMPEFHVICAFLQYRILTLRFEVQLTTRSTERRTALEHIVKSLQNLLKGGKCGSINTALAIETMKSKEEYDKALASSVMPSSAKLANMNEKLDKILGDLAACCEKLSESLKPGGTLSSNVVGEIQKIIDSIRTTATGGPLPGPPPAPPGPPPAPPGPPI